MNTKIVLETRSLSKSVMMSDQPLNILNEVSLSIQQGQSLAIVGESGSGKSTLLGLMAGLDLPTSGSIRLLDQALEKMNEDERARLRAQHVGFVFQAFQLLPNLTALENVMLPLEIIQGQQVTQKANAILAQVGLSHRRDHYPNQLSGGEQQRVALARAFVTEPDILFADEPTGNLDTRTGLSIMDQLFELNIQQHTTLVLVTHDSRLADRCQRQVVMHGGRLQS